MIPVEIDNLYMIMLVIVERKPQCYGTPAHDEHFPDVALLLAAQIAHLLHKRSSGDEIHYVVAQDGIVAVGDDCLIVPFDGRDMEIMACNR